MQQLLIALIAFIIGLGVLVTFHEFGHFWVARKLGVKVIRFSVGFGRPLFKFYGKDGVEYVIAWLPLGGYVKMLDENEGDVPTEHKPFAFNRQALWKRSSIVLAGPVFNFIFAVFAYWLMFMIGIKGLIPIVGEVAPHSIAEKAGIIAEDEIVSISGTKTPNWQQVTNVLVSHIGDEDPVSITVKDKHTQDLEQLSLNISQWELEGKNIDLLKAMGITPYQPPFPAVIGQVLDDEPAYAAGLKALDEIVEVEGVKVSSWQDFVSEIQKHPNQDIHVTALRNGQREVLSITPRTKDDNGKQVGYIGVQIKKMKVPEELIRWQRYSVGDSLHKAFVQTWRYINLTLQIVGKMLTGKLGLDSLSGPITIAQGAGITVQVGIAYYIGFLGLISVSLGVLNLLPIPMLDGGHLLFYAIEWITRRPVPERIQQIGFQFGLLILIFLMGVAFYNDILRLQ